MGIPLALRLHPKSPAGLGVARNSAELSQSVGPANLTGLPSQFSGSIHSDELFGTGVLGSGSRDCFLYCRVRCSPMRHHGCLRPAFHSAGNHVPVLGTIPTGHEPLSRQI